jgi:hypothetical protein
MEKRDTLLASAEAADASEEVKNIEQNQPAQQHAQDEHRKRVYPSTRLYVFIPRAVFVETRPAARGQHALTQLQFFFFKACDNTEPQLDVKIAPCESITDQRLTLKADRM